MEMKKIWEIAQEVSERAGKRAETIVFTDGSITRVTGTWTANKPVWATFQDFHKPEEVAAALIHNLEDAEGIPCRPTGIKEFKQKYPEIWAKIDNSFSFI